MLAECSLIDMNVVLISVGQNMSAGQIPVCQMSVNQMSVDLKSLSTECLSTKCLSTKYMLTKCLSTKYVCQPNVCQPNNLLLKCLLDKYVPASQMALCQMPVVWTKCLSTKCLSTKSHGAAFESDEIKSLPCAFKFKSRERDKKKTFQSLPEWVGINDASVCPGRTGRTCIQMTKLIVARLSKMLQITLLYNFPQNFFISQKKSCCCCCFCCNGETSLFMVGLSLTERKRSVGVRPFLESVSDWKTAVRKEKNWDYQKGGNREAKREREGRYKG